MLSASRPIFVLGTTFSGSSVLSWALAQHPRLAHVVETRWLSRLAADLQSLIDSGPHVADAHPSLATVERTRFYEAFGAAANTLLLTPPDGGRRAAVRRWVDCTPQQGRQVAALIRLFPRAQFVHVLRDVRAVVPLLVHRPVPGRRRHTESSAYAYWLETSKAILEAELALGPERVLRVAYDDLVQAPERTLRHCLRFVSEPYCADCLRPLRGLADAAAVMADRMPTDGVRSPARRDAELLSDLLAPRRVADPGRVARLDAAFARRSRRGRAQLAVLSIAQRVQEAARTVIPAHARVLVISKGDDALLALGTERAGHFPQTVEGIYAGHYPATAADAVAHLEDLRRQGYDFLVIPGPYFWWLNHYEAFATHLRTRFRVVYYQEDNCIIFALARTARGWAAPLGGRGAKPLGEPTAAPAPPPAAKIVAAPPVGRPQSKPAPSPLAQRLWSGFSTYAVPELEEASRSPAAPTPARIDAAWELARWSAVKQDFGEVLRWLNTIAHLDPAQRIRKRHLLLEVRAHLQSGDAAAATSLIALGAARHGYDTDLCLLSANALAADARADGVIDEDGRLSWINRVFTARGLSPIRRIDSSRPLGLDNITAAGDGPPPEASSAVVSIVMPVYNAARTIGFALRSMQEQTWRNLEILVVDDCSHDDTRQIVATLAAADPRIRLIALDTNGGAYVARNAGLAAATGEYLTVHDADDWSHPQMIERQLAHMREHGVVGTVTRWARATSALRFDGSWRPNDQLLDENFASLILPRHVVAELGGWDPVRTGADTEFRRRLEAKYGQPSVPTIVTDVPFSFSLNEEGSLTRQPVTHIRTLHFGVRYEYRRLYERWHRTAARTGDFRLPTGPADRRVFPAPAPILSARSTREYDVVFVCDFALAGGAFVSPYHYLLAALRQGLRVGIFHWRRYDLPPFRSIDERVARLIDDFRIDLLVAEQPAHTAHLVFYYPRLFQHRLDRVPALSFDRMHVIVNQMASRFYSGNDPQYDPAEVGENLRALFGAPGEWFPISPIVRTLMAADSRYPAAGEATWTPLIDTDTWCRHTPHWRGGARSTPVIGRHGRDHYSKWPGTRGLIERAYCVPQRWEARFLGGAEHAIKALGGRPQTWKVWPYDGIGVQDFLHDLDFLVHVPHEDYIEEFGRVAMEAMAAGVPVVLPPRFTATFGQAAVCCEAEGVADHIADLWRDEARYLAQAEAGRQFVLTHCSLDQLGQRLSLPGSGSTSPGRLP